MATEKEMPDALILGRYRVMQPIGSGGLGQVFYGVDEQLQRPVAVKRLHRDGEFLDKASDGWLESRALASLQHPNIITLFDFGEDSEGAFFVMEYIDGKTMEDLTSLTLLSERDFKDIARQCLAGIGAAHELGIIHRDIKPTNIMVQQGASGELLAKILDFGLAKFQKAPEPQTTDHDNNLLGSIYFMAPEQFSREPIDGRADLYALGNVFYYSLTGKMAHAADSIEQILFSHLYRVPVPLHEFRPDLSPGLCLWVHQLMARDPLERPQNAREALQLLESDTSRVTTTVLRTEASGKKSGNSSAALKWISVALLVVLPVCGVIVWLLLQQAGDKAGKPVVVLPVPQAVPTPEPVSVIQDTLPRREKAEESSALVVHDQVMDPLDLEGILAAKGREASFEGVPVRVGKNKNETIFYLNFSENFRSTLSLVFFSKDFPEGFGEPDLMVFVGRKIQIRGLVEEYNGAPQIKVQSLDHLKPVD